jgi:hypothetical protein
MRNVPLPVQPVPPVKVQFPTTTPLASVPVVEEVPFDDVPVKPSW